MSDFFLNYAKPESQGPDNNETSNFGNPNGSKMSTDIFNFGEEESGFPEMMGIDPSMFTEGDQSQIVPPVKPSQQIKI